MLGEATRYEVTFWGDKIFLKLDNADDNITVIMKPLKFIFYSMNVMVCALYLNKACF